MAVGMSYIQEAGLWHCASRRDAEPQSGVPTPLTRTKFGGSPLPAGNKLRATAEDRVGPFSSRV